MINDVDRFFRPTLFFIFLSNVIEGQIDCNNCGNNCGGCKLQFPDPPPIILQPPAPPPNNTCCCDSIANNGVGSNCGGYGSNCGNNCCCGGNSGGSNCGNNCCCGNDCCGGSNCCCGGNTGAYGSNYGNYGSNSGGGNCCGGNDCCCCNNQVQNSQSHTNQMPAGGPQSRTNRCCQVICTKCPCGCGSNCCCNNAGGGNCCCNNAGGGNCCGGNCCGGCNSGSCCCPCCQPCGSFCAPCCCNPCSCYDCCHDCYPNDFDCEIGYKKRKRRKRQLFPTPHSTSAFHRMKPIFQRRFYVLPLPLPAQDDLPPRTHRPRNGHNHHHFHHHFFHCCPNPCCQCGCPPQNNQFQNEQTNFNDCFGPQCNPQPIEPLPCNNANNNFNNNFQQQQQEFYSQFPGSQQSQPSQPIQTNQQFNGCPTFPFSNGFFKRLYERRRRRRQILAPSFGSDKVLNFLIPMFYKRPSPIGTPILHNKCPPITQQRNSRSCGCPTPNFQHQNDFPQPQFPNFSQQNPPINPCNNMPNSNRDTGDNSCRRQCCCGCQKRKK